MNIVVEGGCRLMTNEWWNDVNRVWHGLNITVGEGGKNQPNSQIPDIFLMILQLKLLNLSALRITEIIKPLKFSNLSTTQELNKFWIQITSQYDKQETPYGPYAATAHPLEEGLSQMLQDEMLGHFKKKTSCVSNAFEYILSHFRPCFFNFFGWVHQRTSLKSLRLRKLLD